MRALVFAAALGLASLAQAYPAVGDQAVFDGTVTISGQIQQAQIIFDMTAFNAASGEWTQTQTTTIAGETQIEARQLAADEVTQRSTVLQALANCSAAGGKSGTISVPAGSFKSCALTMNDGGNTMTMFLADVPFATAAFDMTQGDVRLVMKLTSFKNGR